MHLPRFGSLDDLVSACVYVSDLARHLVCPGDQMYWVKHNTSPHNDKRNTDMLTCIHKIQFASFYKSWSQMLDTYSQRQLLTFGHIMDFSFSQFSPFFQNDLERNDTSFESPKIELLESSMKLGVARPWAWPHPLKWKSTPFAKTYLEPFMAKICPVSKLLSNNGY